MGRVAASVMVPGRIADAEALWYDPVRWPAWVDGFGHVQSIQGDWPHAGARLVWDSRPGGRGRVVERVIEHVDREGQSSEVEDERLRGAQRVAFEGEHGQTKVTLSLDYELKDARLRFPLFDLLFVRRPLGESLRRTLRRFATEHRADVS